MPFFHSTAMKLARALPARVALTVIAFACLAAGTLMRLLAPDQANGFELGGLALVGASLVFVLPVLASRIGGAGPSTADRTGQALRQKACAGACLLVGAVVLLALLSVEGVGDGGRWLPRDDHAFKGLSGGAVLSVAPIPAMILQ
jgi:hypothetical protein